MPLKISLEENPLWTMWLPKPKPKTLPDLGKKISIPEWDDILHITPRKKYTKDEKKEYNEIYKIGEAAGWDAKAMAKKLGYPKNIIELLIEETHEFKDTMQENKERFIRIMQSPTPEVVKDFGGIQTQIDNVNDALVIFTYIGRLAVKRFPKIKPYVNKVKDIRSLTDQMMMWQLARLSGKKTKRELEELLAKNKNLSKLSAGKLRRLAKYAPSFSEFVQIAQTTDQLFGVGLCLGPIVGVVEDLAFGLIKFDPQLINNVKNTWAENLGPEIQDVDAESIAALGTIGRTIVEIVKGIKPGPSVNFLKLLLHKAADAMWAPGYTGDLEQDLSSEDHLVVLAGHKCAVDFLTPFMNTIDVTQFPKGWEKRKFSRGPIGTHGGERIETFEDMITKFAPVAKKQTAGWIDKMGQTPAAQFAETLMHDTAVASIECADGGPIPWNYERTPEAQAGVLFLDYGLLDLLPNNPDVIEAALKAAGKAIETSGGPKTPYNVIKGAIQRLLIPHPPAP